MEVNGDHNIGNEPINCGTAFDINDHSVQEHPSQINQTNALQTPTHRSESSSLLATLGSTAMQDDSSNFFGFSSSETMPIPEAQYPRSYLSVDEHIDQLIEEAKSWSTINFDSPNYDPAEYAEYAGSLPNQMFPPFLPSTFGTHTSFDGFPSSSSLSQQYLPPPLNTNRLITAPPPPPPTPQTPPNSLFTPMHYSDGASEPSSSSTVIRRSTPASYEGRPYHCKWWIRTRCPGVVYVPRTACTDCQSNDEWEDVINRWEGVGKEYGGMEEEQQGMEMGGGI